MTFDQEFLNLCYALKGRLANNAVNRSTGLCQNIWELAVRSELGPSFSRADSSRKVTDLAKTWPKFSGDGEYPVPAIGGFESPEDVYWGISDKYSGEYGQLRLELLEWIIHELKTRIEIAQATPP